MPAKVTLIGNEGFRIATDEAAILIDPFYTVIPHVAGHAAMSAADIPVADAILVTHAHQDHFAPEQVLQCARRTGAAVVGPAKVIDALDADLPARQLVELEPPLVGLGQRPAWKRAKLPHLTVTAFRTFHSRDHNSYLVESGGLRFFHDGDNQFTGQLDAAALSGLDLLLIAPWNGSGWATLIEQLAPRWWVCMHLTDEELRQHSEGRFLPDLCERVPLPERLLSLQPGQTALIR